jgi:hypothetical protein
MFAFLMRAGSFFPFKPAVVWFCVFHPSSPVMMLTLAIALIAVTRLHLALCFLSSIRRQRSLDAVHLLEPAFACSLGE